MDDRSGIFAGDDPIAIVREWLALSEGTEPNDPNAVALATVDEGGMPDVRMVLLKEIEPDGFVFYTNYGSPKARAALGAGKAAFVLHWKSLRRQVRVRGVTSRVEGAQADAYFASRHPESRLGAVASRQSEPIPSRQALLDAVARVRAEQGDEPPRPAYWGGIRIRPSSIEFWADGAHRLHDRFLWTRGGPGGAWTARRLSP